MLQDLVMSGMAAELDIVHCHTWYTHLAGCLVQVPARRAAGPDHAFARAAPAVEGRAAGDRVPRLDLDRADRVPERRRRRRRLGVDEAATCTRCTACRTKRSASSTTASTWSSTGRSPIPRVLVALRHRSRRAVRAVRRPHHAAEGDHPPGQRDPALAPGVQVVLCAGAPDTPEIAAEMTAAVERARAAEPAPRSSGSRRCCRRRR